MLRATVGSGMAKMAFLTWLVLSISGTVNLGRMPAPVVVETQEETSTTSQSSPAGSQTLGVVQDIITTPSADTPEPEPTFPDTEYEPSFTSAPAPQPTYTSTPQTRAADHGEPRADAHRSDQTETQQPPQDSPGNGPQLTPGQRLVCVPGVLCI